MLKEGIWQLSLLLQVWALELTRSNTVSAPAGSHLGCGIPFLTAKSGFSFKALKSNFITALLGLGWKLRSDTE